MSTAIYNNTSQQIIAIIGDTNIFYILPQIILSAGALITMITSAFNSKRYTQTINYYLSLLLLAASAIVSAWLAILPSGTAFNGMVRSDLFSGILNVIYCVSAFLITATAHSYFRNRGRYIYELYPLILFAAAGMMFMTTGSDLIVIFLGLEVLSVALYVLTGIDTGDRRSNESSVKYFLMGAFASAFLLYGIALLYGAAGTTSIYGISQFITGKSAWDNTFVSAGIVLILIGFGFKISMVPFHMWTPDVYQGTPLIITAFLSTAPKAAALTALIKVVLVISPDSVTTGWLPDLLAVFAVLTMTVGNLMALNQTDIKRIMAFSSIAHIGYMLVAFAAFKPSAIGAVLFYFTAYILMNIGFFTILALIAKDEDRNLTLEGVQGLAKEKPLFGLFLVIFLFSLAGIPPTAGFSAKFFIFNTAIESELYFLAIIGILNSAVSAYYYLRILLFAYIKEPPADGNSLQNIKVNAACFLVILAAGIGTIWLGIIPGDLIELAAKAVLSL
jgi:NADH-quinone oxidoreductase subunit N